MNTHQTPTFAAQSPAGSDVTNITNASYTPRQLEFCDDLTLNFHYDITRSADVPQNNTQIDSEVSSEVQVKESNQAEPQQVDNQADATVDMSKPAEDDITQEMPVDNEPGTSKEIEVETDTTDVKVVLEAADEITSEIMAAPAQAPTESVQEPVVDSIAEVAKEIDAIVETIETGLVGDQTDATSAAVITKTSSPASQPAKQTKIEKTKRVGVASTISKKRAPTTAAFGRASSRFGPAKVAAQLNSDSRDEETVPVNKKSRPSAARSGTTKFKPCTFNTGPTRSYLNSLTSQGETPLGELLTHQQLSREATSVDSPKTVTRAIAPTSFNSGHTTSSRAHFESKFDLRTASVAEQVAHFEKHIRSTNTEEHKTVTVPTRAVAPTSFNCGHTVSSKAALDAKTDDTHASLAEQVAKFEKNIRHHDPEELKHAVSVTRAVAPTTFNTGHTASSRAALEAHCDAHLSMAEQIAHYEKNIRFHDAEEGTTGTITRAVAPTSFNSGHTLGSLIRLKGDDETTQMPMAEAIARQERLGRAAWPSVDVPIPTTETRSQAPTNFNSGPTFSSSARFLANSDPSSTKGDTLEESIARHNRERSHVLLGQAVIHMDVPTYVTVPHPPHVADKETATSRLHVAAKDDFSHLPLEEQIQRYNKRIREPSDSSDAQANKKLETAQPPLPSNYSTFQYGTTDETLRKIHARPAGLMLDASEPFIPKPSSKPLTEIKVNCMATDERAAKRKTFDDQVKHRHAELGVLGQQLEDEKKRLQQEENNRIFAESIKASPMPIFDHADTENQREFSV